ncbi:hypothetical protein [[Phormidium] sp. ETS-05]|uniref:hypothetical protein n=1 Tax=[Phormidium] sp. ETS-05 TaxID=222819 RepID=UPI0018EF1ABF|nr:hypothetical protein [[Phormidium] sp. ETS-05]
MSVPDPVQAPPDFSAPPPPLIPGAVSVAFLTCPMLLALVAGSGVATFVASVGVKSEDLFLGDRLPPLPFPDAPRSSIGRGDAPPGQTPEPS